MVIICAATAAVANDHFGFSSAIVVHENLIDVLIDCYRGSCLEKSTIFPGKLNFVPHFAKTSSTEAAVIDFVKIVELT